MKNEFLTTTPSQTRKIGGILAKKILKKAAAGKKASVLGLVGDLGGGKTTFLQGFAKGLGIKEKILSPTFVIMKRFDNFYHIDCYRIKRPKDLLILGLREIISNPRNIVALEWAEKVKAIMPKNTIWVNFEFINERTRKIMIK